MQFRCTSLLRMAMPLFVCFLRLVQKQGQNHGATPVYLACLVGHLHVAQVLVKARVDIDQGTTETGATPLYVAAQECCTKIACLLVEVGVDRNKARAIDGATPCQHANRLPKQRSSDFYLSVWCDLRVTTPRRKCQGFARPLLRGGWEGNQTRQCSKLEPKS